MRFGKSLGFPIVVLLIFMTMAALFAGYCLNVTTLRRALESSEADQARTISHIIDSLIREETARLTALSKLLKRDDKLISGLLYYSKSGGDTGPLKNRMDRLYPNLGADILQVTDGKGIVVYQAKAPQKPGEDFSLWGMDQAISGGDIGAAAKEPQHLSIRAVVPLSQGNRVYGTLVVGTRIDHDFARRISREMNMEISFCAPDGMVASSLPPERGNRIRSEAMERSLLRQEEFFEIDETRGHGVLYAPLRVANETFCLAVQTKGGAQQTVMRQGRTRLAVTSVLILLGVAFLGSGVTFLLLDPLKKLQGRAMDLIRDFYSSDLRFSKNGNQIQTLAYAFSRMEKQIRLNSAEQQRAEEALQRVYDELEMRVGEWTEQLGAVNKQLQREIAERKQAEARLEQANAAADGTRLAKTRFLATMAHEIRTPVDDILGAAEFLSNMPLTDGQRDLAETIRVSSEALLKAIDEILEFSRIEAGEAKLESIEFSPHRAIEETACLLTELAHQKNVGLVCSIDHGVPEVLRGDPTRLRQIVSGLFNHAVRSTSEGEVTLRARIVSEETDSVMLRFEMSQTRIGMDSRSPEQIFDVFSPANGSPMRELGGTGLGLAISRQLTAMMGGDIGVESEPGKGHIFWFTARLEKENLVVSL